MPAQPDNVFAVIGACIYCRRRDTLCDEHIVPAGLDGNAILRDASCTDCGRITSAFESRVLNNLRDIRSGLGLGSKRRKTKTRTAAVYGTEDGKEVVYRVPLERHVLPILFPVFPPPQCGVSDERKAGIDLIGLQWVRYGVDPEDVGKSLSIPKVQLKLRLYAADFARVLAKIAYCYAVSQVGLEAFAEVTVLPAILGSSDDVGHWVGTYAKEEAKASDSTLLHRLNLMLIPSDPANETAGLIAVVHVQLFSTSPSPGYRVVVGMLHPGTRLPVPKLLGTEPFPSLGA